MATHDVESSDLMPFLSRFGHVVCVDTTDHDAAEVFAAMEPHIHSLSERKTAERAAREAAEQARAEQAAREAQEAAEAEAAAAQRLLEAQQKAAAEAEALALAQAQEPRESNARRNSAGRRGSGKSSPVPQPPATPAAPAPVPVPSTAVVPSLPPPPRRAVSQALGAVLTQQWEATQRTFLATIKNVFRSLRYRHMHTGDGVMGCA